MVIDPLIANAQEFWRWVKLVHVIMVMAWMTGIFYLPRIFVHYVEGVAAGEDVRRLLIMARRLFIFMTIMAVLAVGSGLILWLYYKMGLGAVWLHGKLVFVVLLIIYHLVCGWMLKKIKNNSSNWSGVALRWFNELTLLIVVGIIYFVVIVKPY